MTDEARAKAVESAEDAFYVAVGLNGAGRSVAGKAAFGAAITAFLAAMAEAGWVMVRDAGECSHHELDSNHEWHRDEGWNACRAAMLKGATDEQG